MIPSVAALAALTHENSSVGISDDEAFVEQISSLDAPLCPITKLAMFSFSDAAFAPDPLQRPAEDVAGCGRKVRASGLLTP